jgi:hypothetical protein
VEKPRANVRPGDAIFKAEMHLLHVSAAGFFLNIIFCGCPRSHEGLKIAFEQSGIGLVSIIHPRAASAEERSITNDKS